MKNLRCSWYLAATIALVVALVSIVHMVFFTLTPSYEYFKVVSYSTISSNASSAELTNGFGKAAIDLKYEFPADLHGAHPYKGTPWKAEIGRWLANCDSLTKDVNISEVIIDVVRVYFVVHYKISVSHSKIYELFVRN